MASAQTSLHDSGSLSTLNRMCHRIAQAAKTPINFQNTEPALQKFDEHVATGGKGAGVMTETIQSHLSRQLQS